MDADPDGADWLKADGARMRVGRTLGRTLYLETIGRGDDDLCVGMVDTAELAQEICRRWNALGVSG